jgi:hypothetical protein
MNKYIFIVGTGRMGSRSLSKTLTNVVGSLSTHEKFPSARHISNRLWDNEITRDEARLLVRQGLDKYKNHDLWIESNCLLWNFIDILHEETDGCANFIYIPRKKEDTINSLFRTGFYGKDKMPWDQRAKRGFISTLNDSYSDKDQLHNCTHGYNIRTEAIEKSLDNISWKQQLTAPFEPMISLHTEVAKIYEFIYRTTGHDIDTRISLINDKHPAPPRTNKKEE